MGSFILIIVTMLAVLMVALAVLFSLLVSRRTVSDWQSHIVATTNELKNPEEDPVVPQRTDLKTVIDEEAVGGSAYLTAEELPRFERRSE
ncbi:MAG: hypothetical protein Q4P06_06790 [Actinomycetaceae bacterium]|nr:hypothetical protein [Actinomycetaceae bacterium]